ncbi:M48 family metallopeptidase [Roseococcus sp. YIM B11640]|uniref:M48 family metallopeptidase n=1 Tax=Roseococcus sp. YIM B11640 TaxID=3133973 RepID=UPI003C7BA33B
MRAIGLSTHVWNNNWRCALLLAGFPVLLALFLFGFSLIAADGDRPLGKTIYIAIRQMPVFLAAGSAIAAVWFAVAWGLHQRIIDGLTGAKEVDRRSEPALWNMMEELCISRGEAMPRLAVIETEAMNAFASGLRRRDGAVTVTRGLMNALSPAELRGVLAHELAHIRNGDARLGVIAAIFAGIMSLVAEMIMRTRFRISGGDRRGGGLATIIGIVLILVASGLGVALRFALSRNREFQADASAVQITGDPDAMIGALRKIQGHSSMPEVPSQVRAMFFDDDKLSLGARYWATHPPIEDRVQALVRFAGGRDPGPTPVPTAGPWARAI